MAWPVVIATNGYGTPVTEAANGTPYEIAANGFGTPVVFVASGGTPVTGGGVAPPSSFAPYPAPSGLKWAFVYETNEGGEQVYETANDPEIELVAA